MKTKIPKTKDKMEKFTVGFDFDTHPDKPMMIVGAFVVGQGFQPIHAVTGDKVYDIYKTLTNKERKK